MTPTTHKETDRAPTLDEIFAALGHSSRRHVLTKIGRQNPRTGEELEEEDLIETEEERQERFLEFYHNHLPSLDAAGFIDWDRESNTITRGPSYEEIQPIIRLMEKHRDELPANWP